MHKDFKIGLGIGLLLVTAAAVWLCTLPKLSTESRALQNASARPAVSPAYPAERPVVSAVEPSRGVERPAPVAIIPQPPVETKPPNPEKPAPRIHVVEKGQTLSQIAEQYYGSQRQWPKILNANRDTLPDPNRLTPGSKLIIPE